MTETLEDKIRELEKKKKMEPARKKKDWIPKDRQMTEEERIRFEKEMEEFLE